MVKVRFGKEEYAALKEFEKIHHVDIWKWIVDKVTAGQQKDGGKQLRILDISDEPSIFAFMFAEQFPMHSVTCAIRDDMPDFEVPQNVRVIKIKELKDIQPEGPFDAIILKELTKEIPDLGAIFTELRTMFEDAKMVILARPKNPPLPLPEICLPLWAKLAFSREDIKSAANQAGYSTVSFSASIPCTVHKFKWESILFSGCYPVVKSSSKCTKEVITNFCKARPPNIAFEEKISMFLLTPSKPDENTQ